MSSNAEMQYRTLGRTGERVSLIGLGGAHLARTNEQEAIRIVQAALDNGMNFLDNSWDYNGGECELRMGKALRGGYRQKAFLMTKIDARTKQAATRQLEESMRRLQVDTIDLLQIHEVIRPHDADIVFSDDGAMEALKEARKAGKIRYIGFTGHKDPDIHMRMLNVGFQHGFTFDTVQMPLNVMDAHFRSFEKVVLPVLNQHNIGVLGMKSMADGLLLRTRKVTPAECLRYVMSLPISVLITGCESMQLLQQALEAARSFQPMSQEEVEALLAKTAQQASAGQYELYKTSQMFDATHFNPQWLVQ